MEILLYNDLAYGKLKKAIDATIIHLKDGNFRSADVKKMPTIGLYRAKLDDTNRLLFKIGIYQSKKYIFVLEVIENHAYEKSRFMNGIAIDENKLVPLYTEAEIDTNHTIPIGYINTAKKKFHILDKILSFDNSQDEILNLAPPSIVIGSAGSGKTALTLEKLKQLPGNVLYVTLSNYLIENASALYCANHYQNENQEVDFLSFFDYISTIQVPIGKEITFIEFNKWIQKYTQSHKIKDSYKIYEEFKGVLTGSNTDKPYLSAQDYTNLGVKQSIIEATDRTNVYELFTKYIKWLQEEKYFDANIVSYHLLEKVEQNYDYVVIDEVQDMTNVQILLVLKALKNPNHFFLCGDSNQIVHPNFFSWSQIKTMFYKQDVSADIIRILATNYRNTPEVTNIANQLLLVKNARFGSIDKESTYLVKPNSTHNGIVEFLDNTPKTNAELNNKTKKSIHFAVIVLRNEDKAMARAYFHTPLLFSIHEAKGLEYENIILFNTISTYPAEFKELTNGVSPEDLVAENITFARAKDKSNKSLDEYKFYVNSLYVGITRAVKNLYVIESNKKHELLHLLGLTNFKQTSTVKDQVSSKEDWQNEAKKLEQQGKKEQADAIRNEILKVQKVPWDVIDKPALAELTNQAFDESLFNKKAKDKLYKYALYYGEMGLINKLVEHKYNQAEKWNQDGPGIIKRYLAEYQTDNYKIVEQNINKYGIDFKNEWNLSPLMLAISLGAVKITEQLIANGAKTNDVDNYGRNFLQLTLLQAYRDNSLKLKVVNKFYNTLKTESLKIKIENKLIKLDSHQAEFLMMQYMIGILRTRILQGTTSNALVGSNPPPVFVANDFIEFFTGLANNVVNDYRKVRSYISSILAKNEVFKGDKYNKKLFLRLQNGMYIPNPNIEIIYNDNWVNLYDLIDINGIEENAKLNKKVFFDIKTFKEISAIANVIN